MNYDEAKLYLEHTSYDDFNLEEHQINNRLDAIKTILKENQQLKLINKEYERLNKENGRGFKITSVKQYNMDELVRCKDNWKQLKEYVEETKIKEFEKTFGKRYGKTFTQAEIIVCNMIKNKIKELERGVSDEN